jgi:hypothetical protein
MIQQLSPYLNFFRTFVVGTERVLASRGVCGKFSQEGACGGKVVDLFNARYAWPILGILFAPAAVVVDAEVLEGRCLAV